MLRLPPQMPRRGPGECTGDLPGGAARRLGRAGGGYTGKWPKDCPPAGVSVNQENVGQVLPVPHGNWKEGLHRPYDF